ncbi:MAG: translational GTPase TypA [Clostridiales bacterium]|jgi:GTP-binding protein|nr:translational GTPase TypA [Clostridiales bacterium]
MKNQNIRNVAIIAHVDHGKTTLVDQMLKQGGVFRANQHVADRVMDSNDLEKERGITILAKNTSINYKDYKINVVDTPGHADFGGEVERVLKMVNGVILLVDAYEGTMPQTRFVLQKALELDNKVIIVVNKIDRPDARVNEVCDEVLELLMELNATHDQLDSPIVYCSARYGTSTVDINQPNDNFIPLFDTIIRHIDAPEGDPVGPFQMLISALDYNDYVGAIGIGRIEHGTIVPNTNVVVTNYYNPDKIRKSKVVAMFRFEGLDRIPVDQAESGEIVCISGIEDLTIGDTVCHPDNVQPISFPKIDEPSVEMTFAVNDSPFAGKEGKFVTSRNLRERLYKECIKDVSIRVSDTDSSEAFKVCGRGEMHLSILIENMRREGYEFQVSMPKVLFKRDDSGKLSEPIDRMIADVPNDCVGAVMNKMGIRKGELVQMTPFGDTRMKLEFDVPSRGLFGYKSEFLTDTKGEGILNSIFDRYDAHRGEIERRSQGSLIVHETGETTTYGLYNAQERGSLFVGAGVPVYAGMVVGENAKSEDVVVNVCKKKQLTNMRASGSDDSLRLTPHKVFSLEQSLTFIADDEYLEVTPKTIRIRKKILDNKARKK